MKYIDYRARKFRLAICFKSICLVLICERFLDDFIDQKGITHILQAVS